MFGPRFTLFSLLGFRVQADLSWFFLALLVAWTLAAGVFPAAAPGLERATYWWMGIAGTIGLLLSLVLHELAHAVVARHHGIPIRGITLFIFGGVAEMTDEPPSARAEFWMAIAGPAASLVLALAFKGAARLGAATGAPAPVVAVVSYLALLNLILVAFNVVPAFPLDGGRVLRALLWWRSGDMHAATRTAARGGAAFGLVLIALGVLDVIVAGDFIGGMWWCLIGLFLRGAANASYAQLLAREALKGARVAQFMTAQPIAVPPDISVAALVEDYIYTHHHEQFPVADRGRPLGIVGTRQVRQIPRERWADVRVETVMVPRSDANCVGSATEATEALALMSRNGLSRLMIADDDRLVGILTLKDMLDFIALRLDLERMT